MVPTQRTYGLLTMGGAIATLLTTFAAGPARFSTGLLMRRCFEGVVWLAMLWDGWQVRQQR